jgi:hypothetical protein
MFEIPVAVDVSLVVRSRKEKIQSVRVLERL